MAVVGIDHVQIAAPAGCEDAARGFYGDLLGMAELPKPEALRGRGGVWFRAGGQELHVGVEAGFVPARKAHAGLVVSDLEELCGRLRAGGFEPQEDDSLPGVARVFVDDPFGNRLELRQLT